MESEPDCSSESRNPNDDIKILIATDNHLSFETYKNKGARIEDSFITFEEILQYGVKYEVDLVLLGGDLFHETKPTQVVMLKCFDLLRKYCLGSRKLDIQFLTEPEVVFHHSAHKTVNFEDPNINVSMPIFSIHGNHDDPSFGTVGSMDILSSSGLVNYFGKWTDLKDIKIPPIVIKRGETRVALYGLSYINDQRLSRLLRDSKVNMLRPEDEADYFNILMLHQNRVPHVKYDYIPDYKLPDLLNLIIWGHEHECRIKPEFIPGPEYYIVQPGSSVATSLCEAEAKPKHVGLLTINKKTFKMKALPLKTVRPFIFDNLYLSEHEIDKKVGQSLSDAVFHFVEEYIEDNLISKAATLLTGHPKQPIQPLLRLRVHCTSDEEKFDASRLAGKYCDEVLNPTEMVIFRKLGINENRKTKRNEAFDDEAAELFLDNDDERDWSTNIQDEITKHFSESEHKYKLSVLTVGGLNEALNRFVVRSDTDAFKDLVQYQIQKVAKHLGNCEFDDVEDINLEIRNYGDKLRETDEEDRMAIKTYFDSRKKTQTNVVDIAIEEDSDDNDNMQDESRMPGVRSKRGRGTSKARGSTRGRGKTAPTTREVNIMPVKTPRRSKK